MPRGQVGDQAGFVELDPLGPGRRQLGQDLGVHAGHRLQETEPGRSRRPRAWLNTGFPWTAVTEQQVAILGRLAAQELRGLAGART